MVFGINTTILWYFKIISNFTRLTAREISYNNFEISLVVFMPNITTNHAITYTNLRVGDTYTNEHRKKVWPIIAALTRRRWSWKAMKEKLWQPQVFPAVDEQLSQSATNCQSLPIKSLLLDFDLESACVCKQPGVSHVRQMPVPEQCYFSCCCFLFLFVVFIVFV